ncbi:MULTISPECIES: nitroreductase family protein [Acetobacterium]|jgi:nitroreductase/NAD-dependent dihydropyrimidine dehydrogenase PreA subunit|uniref:Putative NAD(P)H nitroreductase n=1 Tax=Acetobacterium wieringae TaxID=52694 RepID=A0A1F2PK59_9FIRM|nr:MULTISPECIES: nitroreductase family protein [Acetobacterium]MEA4805724.1 nitroreductase family protein [Acetobacterium wieringae]OFV71096.1 putative NAD(P)H nitroreductase [Acetobacterium wieringae]
MIKIDQEKCIGCGACVEDCFTRDLVIEADKAKVLNKTCIKCGHCIAICPVNAVSISDYDMSEVKEYEAASFDIEPENLLNFIKFRRSVRQFKDQPIEKEKLETIIEAGRFTPTGGNRQPVSFVVVQDQLSELTGLALESLNNLGKVLLADREKTPPLIAYYAERWLQMYEGYLANPQKTTDLFFNAQAVVIIVSESPIDGGLAASSMELMTHAQGLGMFYSGFFVRAAANSEKIRRFLGIEETNKQVIACQVMGYPKVSYQRTVPRKKPVVSWR